MLAIQIAAGIIGGVLGLIGIAEGWSFIRRKRESRFTPNWPLPESWR